MFKRKQFDTLYKRLNEPIRFIQVVTGPRQAGLKELILVIDEVQKISG